MSKPKSVNVLKLRVRTRRVRKRKRIFCLFEEEIGLLDAVLNPPGDLWAEFRDLVDTYEERNRRTKQAW